jgi:carbon monoxide dehydrogenase subunit G
MEILGQQLISAPRQKVWDALNDPLILKECLPGCESVEQLWPEEFRVIIKNGHRPLESTFSRLAQNIRSQSTRILCHAF